MKQAVAHDAFELLGKLDAVQKDMTALKLSLLKKLAPSKEKVVKLRGVLKDVDISEMDIADAQKSLYGKIEI
jgi:hypothetical protein